jgi:hypothetical protein
MRRHQLSGLLLRPSLCSSILCTLGAVGVVIAANWTFVLENILLYDYFFAHEGLVTTLQTTPDGGSAISEALTSKSLAHNAAILGGALLAGVGLYVIVRVLVSLVNSISMTLKEMNAVEGPAKHAVEHELEKRIGIRALVALVWIAFTFISVKVVLPFCILASEVGLDEKKSVGEGIGYVFFAIVLTFVTLHLHVILARLLLLRPRIFGGEEVMLQQ